MVSPCVIATEPRSEGSSQGPPSHGDAKPRLTSISEDEIAAFYIELRPSLCASLRRKLPQEDIEDVVQEAFVRLLSQGPENLNSDNLRYWLFRVAHNLAIDQQRSGWRYLLDSKVDFDLLLSEAPSADFNPEKIYSDSEQWQAVQDNLAKLTPRQRLAIHLRITGFSYKAIAQRLKSTTHSIAELVRRGLKRLGAQVKNCEK